MGHLFRCEAYNGSVRGILLILNFTSMLHLPPSTARLAGRQAVVLTTRGKVLSRRMLRLVEELAAD
jgi:hypothetical protein